MVEANPAFERMLGYTAAELAVMSFAEYTHPDDVDENMELFRSLMAGERESYRMQKRSFHRDGRMIWTQVNTALERDPDGKPLFAVSMLEDITERKRAEEELREQAELNEHQSLHDALTGLPNRTLFRDRIVQSILAAQRDGRQRGRDDDRPRPLQGGQRLARPRRRRLAAPGGRAPPRRRAARLRHDRPARRRRVRRAAPPPVQPGGRAPRDRPDRRRARAAGGARRAAAGDRGLARRRHVPGARRQRGHAPPARRHGDVHREGEQLRVRLLRRERRALRPEPADARVRAAAGDRRARAGPLLPAEEDRRERRDRVRRGAAALGAPDARPRASERLHPGGPADQPDPAADALRHRRGAAPVPPAGSTTGCSSRSR